MGEKVVRMAKRRKEREQNVVEVELRRTAAGDRAAKNDVRGGGTRGEI